jgi:hypothetical protein
MTTRNEIFVNLGQRSAPSQEIPSQTLVHNNLGSSIPPPVVQQQQLNQHQQHQQPQQKVSFGRVQNKPFLGRLLDLSVRHTFLPPVPREQSPRSRSPPRSPGRSRPLLGPAAITRKVRISRGLFAYGIKVNFKIKLCSDDKKNQNFGFET